MESFFKVVLFCFIAIFVIECKQKSNTLFTLLDTEDTGINFKNDLPYTEEFNTYTYRNFYNGGGVALGDINNDGLLDIYFSGNITDNKLYLNKGNWKFEDITEKAGVACKNVWSSGVTFVDINGDGLLDLYVCKAGKPEGENRHNELFINQGNLTFKEQSKEYGLDITGLSIHAAFFDYDKDGDLDCYILNNSLRSVGGFDLKENQRMTPDPEGNKFMRNDNGVFKNVTTEAGIYSSNIGYGLGITLSDFNQDNWPDVIISNDFFERDYLYINNQNGTFSEVGDKAFASMSMGSMGADAADLDNDLLTDLFVTEMLPASLERKKTKNQYETWDKYKTDVKNGYHHQYSRNVLQRNIGKGQFLEIGRQAGVAATEWSWAALIQDFDNDGKKDLFVSNGLYKDLLDKDYLNFFADATRIRAKIENKEKVLLPLIDSMPSTPQRNFMYKNEGDFSFKDVSNEWGFDALTFSNGSAYGDLDNDGDLDLVVNNANMPSFIYRNNTDTLKNKSIQIKLVGEGKNTRALNAKVIVKHSKGQSVVENYSARGFESSVADKLTIGLGNIDYIDSLIVLWPNNKKTILTKLKTNKLYTLNQGEANSVFSIEPNNKIVQNEEAINFIHQDNYMSQFSRERMMTEMIGFDGPAMAVADVNKDGIDDVFFGGGKNQSSVLQLSNSKGKYNNITKPFAQDISAEKVKAIFFDSDNDGDKDLYVAHGGKNFTVYSPELNDVLYINDGKGNFVKKLDFTIFPQPISTGALAVADVNKDGKLDIVIGEKMKVDLFGLPGSCYVLNNQGNNSFKCESPKELKDIGMVSDIVFFDKNKDGWKDLVIAGKWMPIVISYNNKGFFNGAKSIEKIPQSTGLWNKLFVTDVDQDGDEDIICGNQGINNFYKQGQKMYINDFDNNGSQEQIICEEHDGKNYTIHDNDEMFSQMPFLKKKFLYHTKLAKASIEDLFDKKVINDSKKYSLELLHSIVLINDKNNFTIKNLPSEIQYSSINAINKIKDGKGKEKLYFGGNFFQVKPQFGKQDASQGWSIDLNKNIFSSTSIKPLYIEGQIRNIEKVGNKIIFAINNDKLKFYNE